MAEEQTELQKFLLEPKKSSIKKYQKITIGNYSSYDLLRYEIITSLFGSCPGAMGLFLRGKFYKRLLREVGRNVIWGRNIVLRHPHKIKVGNNVLMEDNCVLDAKGEDNQGIVIGDNVMLGRNTIITTKDGFIEIGNNANIGSNCRLGTTGNLKIGKNVLVGAYTYLAAGGEHKFERTGIPIIAQGEVIPKGIVIEDNVWLGARVTVLDGVKIGRDAIIGACGLVSRDIPEFVIAYGIPAKVIRERK